MRKFAVDRNGIVPGRPLPFSVFDPARNMLLAAKGQVVTEWMREALSRSGLVAVADDDAALLGTEAGAANAEQARSALFDLRLHYARAAALSRSGFRVSRDERSESYTCRVVGVSERRSLLLTAPARDDRTYVAINEGQTWLFRTFYATAAIRFTAVIDKIVFEPFPYFHIDVPALVEMRHIRRMQRVATCLNATLEKEAPVESVITDLSSSGMRIAVNDGVELNESQQVKLQFRLTVLGQRRDMNCLATVVRCLGNADSQHPQVRFYGLSIDSPSELDQMILHSYVQGCVIQELDGLSKLLTS